MNYPERLEQLSSKFPQGSEDNLLLQEAASEFREMKAYLDVMELDALSRGKYFIKPIVKTHWFSKNTLVWGVYSRQFVAHIGIDGDEVDVLQLSYSSKGMAELICEEMNSV